jgi:glyoxylase-like metal-dependent hydrolase (beta-lactamase superfamily II)
MTANTLGGALGPTRWLSWMAGATAVSVAVFAVAGLAAAQDFEKVEIRTTELGAGLYMLAGAGGNLAVSVGDDGVFLVDDEYAALTPKLRAAVSRLSDRPVRFVVNTHWHSDHTGGNQTLGEQGTVIVAHEAVRVRMSSEQFIAGLGRRVPASAPAALPVVTFTEGLRLHLNVHAVNVIHVEKAHTDGDALVHFEDAGVLHMGDVYFCGMYPFIDLSSGGSLDGVIAAVDRGLELADAKTRVIPGHGPLSSRAELGEYRAMLVSVRERVAKAIGAGSSSDEIVAGRPTADLDARWGGGFVKADDFVRIVAASLAAAR